MEAGRAAEADVESQYIDSLDLDWDGKTIDELAADERCPPCFRSELLGPCGKEFAPAYKCFRLCEIEKKSFEICGPLMKAYSDCMNRHPLRYRAMFSENNDQDERSGENIPEESATV